MAQEALFRAAQVDDVALAEFALDKGADIEALDARGLSPLRAGRDEPPWAAPRPAPTPRPCAC